MVLEVVLLVVALVVVVLVLAVMVEMGVVLVEVMVGVLVWWFLRAMAADREIRTRATPRQKTRARIHPSECVQFSTTSRNSSSLNDLEHVLTGGGSVSGGASGGGGFGTGRARSCSAMFKT